MTAEKNRQILLALAPLCGEPSPDNFKLVETAVPEAGPDQMLLHTVYLSLDPYMGGRMDAGASYGQPVEVGKVMEGMRRGREVESPTLSEIVPLSAGSRGYSE